MRRLLVILLLTLPVYGYIEKPVTASVRYCSTDTVLNSTCRISTPHRPLGTGTVFCVGEDYVWIFAAGHMFDSGNEILIEFFCKGIKSHRMTAEIVSSVHEKKGEWEIPSCNDLAILKVKNSDFKNYPLPKFIPLAEKGYKIKVNDIIVSCGCAEGRWPSLWRGNVVEVCEGSFWFHPPGVGGRSGSGIFNKDGTKLIGILIATDHERGLAVSLETIYELTGWD